MTTVDTGKTSNSTLKSTRMFNSVTGCARIAGVGFTQRIGLDPPVDAEADSLAALDSLRKLIVD